MKWWFSLDYGIFTSLGEAHEDGHGSIDAYIAAKTSLLKHSKISLISDQVLSSWILPSDIQKVCEHNIHTKNWATNTYGRHWVASWSEGYFSLNGERVCTDELFDVLGEHMRRNVSVGLLLLDLNWLVIHDFQTALKDYIPLPHRLQNIGRYKEITWINDSFATTGNSVAACIRTLWEDLETLFVGWYDNWANPKLIIDAIKASYLQNIILFPTTGKLLRLSLGESYNYLETSDITEAITWAYKVTTPGKYAALSCWYPSFTMRDNYVHRWKDFTKNVQQIWKE